MIHALLARAIRIAEREYDVKRTAAASNLVTLLRQALGAVEVYEEKQR